MRRRPRPEARLCCRMGHPKLRDNWVSVCEVSTQGARSLSWDWTSDLGELGSRFGHKGIGSTHWWRQLTSRRAYHQRLNTVSMRHKEFLWVLEIRHDQLWRFRMRNNAGASSVRGATMLGKGTSTWSTDVRRRERVDSEFVHVQQACCRRSRSGAWRHTPTSWIWWRHLRELSKEGGASWLVSRGSD